MTRKSFSLIEIMVSLGLICLFAGATTFALKPFYEAHSFRIEVEKLYDLIQEVQLEALTLESDMRVVIFQEHEKWLAQSVSDETILKPQTVHLPHVKEISLGSIKSAPISITFYASGFINPQVVLTLSCQNEHRYLDFRTPLLIKFNQTPPQLETP